MVELYPDKGPLGGIYTGLLASRSPHSIVVACDMPFLNTKLMQKPEDRSEVLRHIFEAAGCKLEQFYISAIKNKAYLIVESPDLNSVYTVGANFMAGGTALFLKYTPLLTVPEAVDFFKKAASLGFRLLAK